MSGINGSADGDLRQQIHQSIDLNQQVHSETELNSSPSNDLSELQSSLESMLTKEVNSFAVMVINLAKNVMSLILHIFQKW